MLFVKGHHLGIHLLLSRIVLLHPFILVLDRFDFRLDCRHLLHRGHLLVAKWKESKVDNEEEYSRQRITRAALRLVQEELDQKIAQMMIEIEADLGELGIQVSKRNDITIA